MSRVTNLDSAAKRRNQCRRTIAEMLRRLGQKSLVDDEARDMVALIVLSLLEIDEGIEQSARAWEQRDYWYKAEALRQRWSWTRKNAAQLTSMLHQDDTEQIPAALASLFPHFSDVRINRYVRGPDLWRGCYRRLEQLPQSHTAGH